MFDETKSVLDETNSAKQLLDNDGMYFGLLTNPKEEETMQQCMVKDLCAYCGGTGAIRCNHCGGTGINENSSLLHDQCHGCKGTGRETCQSCRGTGEWRHRSEPRATNTSWMEEHSENRVVVMKEYIGSMSDERVLFSLRSSLVFSRRKNNGCSLLDRQQCGKSD
jgi:hypothetical protein